MGEAGLRLLPAQTPAALPVMLPAALAALQVVGPAPSEGNTIHDHRVAAVSKERHAVAGRCLAAAPEHPTLHG